MSPQCFSTAAIVVLFFGGWAAVPEARGQMETARALERILEDAARYEIEFGLVGIEYNGIGNPIVRIRHPGGDFSSAASVRLNLLFVWGVAAELDLTEKQAAQLGRLKNAFTSASQAVAQRLEEQGEAGKQVDPAKLYGPVYRQVWQDARNVLLPHQRRRLDQLAARAFIRQFGWLHALYHRPLKEVLEVTPAQRAEIAARAKRLLREIESEAWKSERRAVSELLACLTEEKRRKAREVLEPSLKYARPAIDLLIWNLERFYDPPKHKENDPAAEQRPAAAPRLAVELPIARPDQGRILMDLFPVARREVVVIPTLTYPGPGGSLVSVMLLSSSVRRELELADFQQQTLSKQFYEEWKVYRSLFHPLMREFEYNVAMEIIRKKQEPIHRAMVEALLPAQKERLVRIIVLRQIRTNGLPQMLEGNHLKPVSALTAGEKEALRKTAERLAKRLKRQRRDWETRVEQELVAVLDANQRSALKKLLGPPRSGDDAWISLTLDQLRHGKRDRVLLGELWRKMGLP